MKTKRRNPQPPHRHTKNNALRTEKRIEKYMGKAAILATWETMAPDALQIREHDYLLKLRASVRQERNLLMHRAVDVKI